MESLQIINGTILTMDPANPLIEKGALVIRGPLITYCGPAQQAPPGRCGRALDAQGGLILPGLINGHTHAAMTLMRGLADDLPLDQWLNGNIFPAEQKLTGEGVYWGALLACAEMIKNGVTSFCDMYLYAREVARAVDRAGLRAVVGEVIYDFPSPSYGELENGFTISQELINQYKDHPRIAGAVMPHAIYTCSPSLLDRAGRLCCDLDADLNIHLAETALETRQAVERYGRRPLAHLETLGLVNPQLWIDHGVDLNQQEIELLAQAGARMAHCPESNMKLASGIAPLPALLEAGVKVGLGTDGCASNNDLDILGEMDTCAKLHKVAALDPSAAPAGDVLAMATSLGAAAFGRDDLGILKENFLADVIVINTNQPHLTPIFNPPSHLVYSARGSDVTHTVCHGQVLMEDRRLTSLDEAEVLAQANQAARHWNGRL